MERKINHLFRALELSLEKQRTNILSTKVVHVDSKDILLCADWSLQTLNNISSDFDKLAKEFGYKTDFYTELCKKLKSETEQTKKR